jgi:large subunit ribosomal protein L23
MTTVYDVLRRPYITEKSNYQSGVLNQYVFEVTQDATKAMIKSAVETLFDVEVVRVNVMNMPLKRNRKGRNRRVATRRTAYKKAIVTLAAGDTIEAFEGVK